MYWAVELGEYDIIYEPRISLKGQAIADFIAEFTYPESSDQQGSNAEQPLDVRGSLKTKPDQLPLVKLLGETAIEQQEALENNPVVEDEGRKYQIFHQGILSDQEFDQDVPIWNLYVDVSSCSTGSAAGVILNSLDGSDIEYALRFQFKASNNEAEYEAMIVGLSLAKTIKAEQVVVFSDSQLIVNQILGVYAAKGELMVMYHVKAMEVVSSFTAVQLVRIPRADALARLASATRTELRRTIPIEILVGRSIDEDLMMNVIALDLGPSWIDPIRAYIEEGTLPSDKLAAKKLKFKAARYVLTSGILYRRGVIAGLQRFIPPK